ncbi:MAG: hypothetical protein CL406_00505 [Acidimicrobiaceae bacterium]|nr:hypothetical protein [Acidimicrobiaceae bacterium]MDP6480706.1 hypothetical protein [Acidimicrobiales bacterium]MDP6696230.1 hypothetical protein [Acidimicrobiales bacterium]
MIPETVGRLGVLAHQGGWDEILLVALPMCVLAGLLWMADRRARRLGRSAEHGSGTDQPGSE